MITNHLVNASELVRAQEFIKVLAERNAGLIAANERWVLTFKAAVDLDQATGRCDLVVTAYVGKRAASRRVPRAELLAFAGNYETLSDEIAISLLLQLFEQQVKSDLREHFITAARNIERLAGKGDQ